MNITKGEKRREYDFNSRAESQREAKSSRKRNPKMGGEEGGRFDAIASNPVINQRLSSLLLLRERERERRLGTTRTTGVYYAGAQCRASPRSRDRRLPAVVWVPLRDISSSPSPFTWPPFSTDATGDDDDRVSPGPRVIRSSPSSAVSPDDCHNTERGRG